MYRGCMTYGSDCSGFWRGQTADFKPTAIIFKARTVKEATRKMDKFILAGEILGSFFMKEL